jgi:DNA-binding response OmpR family regulator
VTKVEEGRVLIAENDPGVRSQLHTRILESGVFCDSVCSPDEAIELLRKGHYALMLLDLDLGNDEGDATLDHIRSLPYESRPIVLATTSRSGTTTVDVDLVQMIIRKPLRLPDLVEMIRSCLHEQAGRGPASPQISG